MRVLYNKLRRLMEQIDLFNRLPNIILDMAISAAISELTSYVTKWCWNHARVQGMRRKFQGLLSMARRILSNLTDQLSNTAIVSVRRLLRELQNVARQGIQLLAGLPTHVNLRNAREMFERIRVIAFKLKDLLLRNAREAGVHPRIKGPPFNPRYLRRRTRFQGLSVSLSLKNLTTAGKGVYISLSPSPHKNNCYT